MAIRHIIDSYGKLTRIVFFIGSFHLCLSKVEKFIHLTREILLLHQAGGFLSFVTKEQKPDLHIVWLL